MECKEIQKLIKEFAEEKLSLKQEEEIAEHLGNCDDCREELEIYYIIEYGLSEDESMTYASKEYEELTESYDFKGLVDLKLKDVKEQIRKEKEYVKVMKTFLIAANLLLLSAAAVMMFF